MLETSFGLLACTEQGKLGPTTFSIKCKLGIKWIKLKDNCEDNGSKAIKGQEVPLRIRSQENDDSYKYVKL